MAAAFEFRSAIVRTPASSVTDGLRVGDHAGPAHEEVAAEHRAYVSALEGAGLAVEVLEALDAYPDSVFVEDPAFVTSAGAILLRPGAPSREGESGEIAPALRRRFGDVATLEHGYADGGDILIQPGEILIGLSARTDREGADSFVRWAEGRGLKARIVQPPSGVLHLKSACSLVDEQSVIATPGLAATGIFGGLEVIATPEGEEAAANLLRVNNRILVSAGYPRTAALLAARGLDVGQLETGAIQKLDAGLSCMSLRW